MFPYHRRRHDGRHAGGNADGGGEHRTTQAGEHVNAEGWYRRILRAYPEQHRDELLGTLMEAYGDRIPSARESLALVRGAFAAHARRRATRPVRWWADGLHLAALGLAIAAFGTVLVELRDAPARPIVCAVLVLAVLRGRFRLALPIAVFIALQNDLGDLLWTHDRSTDWRFGASLWVTVAVLLVVTVRGPHGRHPRSWWWLAIPAAGLLNPLVVSVPVLEIQAFAESGLLFAGLCATVAARDLRWLLAVAVYLIPGVLGNFDDLHMRMHSPMNIAYYGTLFGILLATAIAAYDGRRRV